MASSLRAGFNLFYHGLGGKRNKAGVIEEVMSRVGIQDRNAEGQMAVDFTKHRNIR